MVDIAAGHGTFGVEIAKRFPDAEVTAVDWANVLAAAGETADAESLGTRYTTIPGSAFEKVKASLVSTGRVITLEFVPNDDRISPASADFALIMPATTPAGDAYTFRELSAMFQNAGFGRSEIHAVPNSKEHVIITHASSETP